MSSRVLKGQLFIDTSATFTVTDIYVQDSGPRFVSAQIQVDAYHVRFNVARDGVAWARRSR